MVNKIKDLNLAGETASQVGLRTDMEHRHFYHLAGKFLETANARNLQVDLGCYLHDLFKNKTTKQGE
jgi:hypothetical protein